MSMTSEKLLITPINEMTDQQRLDAATILLLRAIFRQHRIDTQK